MFFTLLKWLTMCEIFKIKNIQFNVIFLLVYVILSPLESIILDYLNLADRPKFGEMLGVLL